MSSNIFKIFILKKLPLTFLSALVREERTFQNSYTYTLPLFTCCLIIYRAFVTPLPSNWNVSIINNISKWALTLWLLCVLLWLIIFLKLSLQIFFYYPSFSCCPNFCLIIALKINYKVWYDFGSLSNSLALSLSQLTFYTIMPKIFSWFLDQCNLSSLNSVSWDVIFCPTRILNPTSLSSSSFLLTPHPLYIC